jgi:hypothetical protein
MEDRNQILCAQTQDVREAISAFLGSRLDQVQNATTAAMAMAEAKLAASLS